MIENLPREKNQSIYFLLGFNEIRRKHLEIVQISRDVLTQNSLDAILVQAKLLFRD